VSTFRFPKIFQNFQNFTTTTNFLAKKYFTPQMSGRVCPITQCPITQYGITIFGGIYEANAIKEWLNDNITDPCTNLILPVSYLFEPKKTNLPIESLAKLYTQSIRQWCRFLLTVDWYKKQNPVEMKQIRGTTKNEAVVDFITTRKCYNSYMNNEEQYRNPNGASLTNLVIEQEYGSFKSMNLIAADMRGCKFVGCGFGNCNFSFADISDCSFIGCSFSGDTCFHGTDINNGTVFIDCDCEETWNCAEYDDKKNVHRLLRQRGLHGLKIGQVRETE
jgi:hypothetical protein